jgi:hypothetical protein
MPPSPGINKRPYDDYAPEEEYYSQSRKKQKTQPSELFNSWKCPACGNCNYPDRLVCNLRKCAQPRPENTKLWKCSCGNLNYPSRTKCNLKHCQLPRPPDSELPNYTRNVRSKPRKQRVEEYDTEESLTSPLPPLEFRASETAKHLFTEF